jgi:murein DD-endopeptidase MepM/ murein hydrolase activator NlpD
MTDELEGAVVVDFPLRGEWTAFNTPADRIPSHGTDMLGQRYAFDFVRVDRRKGWHIHPAGGLRSNLLGFPIRETYAWGQPVHMPFDGEIVDAQDGWPERTRIVPIREIALVLKNGLTFNPTKLRSLLGNFVLARTGSTFAAFAHLTTGSVAVKAGQAVTSGELIGRVGHTGNSTAPHLHFQLMDSPDAMTARGIPCAFRRLEIERDGTWELAESVIPRRVDRIRYPEDSAVTEDAPA